MNIVVIGSGGREHALVWKLQQSKLADKIFVIPGNGGTKNNMPFAVDDFRKIKAFCRRELIQLIVVGPEIPLAKGIVDEFKNTPVMVFGPEKRAALLESSKIWAKKFMQKYGVATADFWEVNSDNPEEIKKIISKLKGNCVVKFDGLAAGKGVFVCSSEKEALSAIKNIQTKYGEKAAFLIEKKLKGEELSILAITDGKSYKLLQSSQDHKQLLEDDKGPNTGGMGAISPAPFFKEKIKKTIIEKIIKLTMHGISQENFDYKGVIYFGLMLTAEGPKLLEYNVRLGDPETEVVLPALKSDLLQLILSCFEGNLSDFDLQFYQDHFIDVVLASEGYPKSYEIGFEITGQENLEKDTLLFHAGTKRNKKKLLTSGGRVLNVVTRGKTLNEARKKVYKECGKIEFEKKYYRKDIGKRN